MRLKKRWLILALILVGLFASLESAPRTFVIKMTVPVTSQCPCNPGPYGTSLFAGSLRDAGYEVRSVAYISDLQHLNLSNISSVVIVIIAPTNFSEKYVKDIQGTVEYLLSENKEVYIAVFDEYPRKEENSLLSWSEKNLCNEPIIAGIAMIVPTNPDVTVAFSDGSIVSSGYTSYVSVSGTQLPLSISEKPKMGKPYGYDILATVYPGPKTNPWYWYPLVAGCKSYKGGVLISADSSIIINLALETDPVYKNESVNLIKYLAPPNNTIVVFDEGVFANKTATVGIRLHPSFLLIQGSKIYAALEESALKALNKIGLKYLVVVLAGLIVMVASWGSSTASSGLKIGRKEHAKPFRISNVRRPVRGSCEAILHDMRLRDIPGIIRGVVDPRTKEEALMRYRKIVNYCEPSVLSFMLRYLGIRRLDLEREYGILLSLLGIEPAVDAY